MKARVKATGEIVEVAYHGLGVYVDMNQWDKEYQFDEIVVFDNGNPDYWERLKHQYAGMAMQGIVENKIVTYSTNEICSIAATIAHALVEKLKEERK